MSVRFDDPNLVSCAGLVPVLALAARCGLGALVAERVRIAARGGTNAAAKILALVAGMVLVLQRHSVVCAGHGAAVLGTASHLRRDS